MAVTSAAHQALERLRDAIDSHDPDRVAACFTEDFRADLPHHPQRSFVGSTSVKSNWTAIFANAPDLSAVILRTADAGDESWSEWQLTGTDPSGAPVVFAGPVILTLRDGEIATARFYLDVVDPPQSDSSRS